MARTLDFQSTNTSSILVAPTNLMTTTEEAIMARSPALDGCYRYAPKIAQNSLRYIHGALVYFSGKLVREILYKEVLNNEKFQNWPASATKHHVFQGGLVVHTAEVLRYAITAGEAGGLDTNKTILTVAAVMHDFAKIYDYQLAPADSFGNVTSPQKWVEAPYRKLVRHVSGSHAHFIRIFDNNSAELFSDETFMAIQHCILAHHGLQEWGSPVEPQTLEARLLHNADMVSALHGDRAQYHPIAVPE